MPMDSADTPHETVGVALSGGVDSTYAAWLLKQQGYDVRAFTMQLAGQPTDAVAKGRRAAAGLGIPHEVLELGDAFDRMVLTPFAEAYAAGLTPSPCVLCNAYLKFGLLADAIRAAGCRHVATGHYVRHDREHGLRRGLDPLKDQSYFLAWLRPGQLDDALFPLGECRKADVTAAVQALGLVDSAPSESQDLCFLPDGDVASFVAARHPELRRPGKIVTVDGRILGDHDGAYRYTRGQRRGLGLGGGPWFVLYTDIAENLVVVGHEDETRTTVVHLGPLNWSAADLHPASGQPLVCRAQLRYRMAARPAELRENADGTGTLRFEAPVSAVTPGQLAVCYLDARVAAGAWIV